MSQNSQSKHKFIEVLKQNDDYDVIIYESGYFLLESLLPPSKTVVQKKNPDEKEKPGRKKIQFIPNKYENLTLKRCFVNIYALKEIIRSNLDSLREIYIHDCYFYLSDYDALRNSNSTSNLRMLTEINLIWLIEQLKFVNIEIIEFWLRKESWDSSTFAKEFLKSAKSTLFNQKEPTKSNAQGYSIGFHPKLSDSAEKKKAFERETFKRNLKKHFQSEPQCSFLKYEKEQKESAIQFLQKENLDKIAESLVWDSVQSKEGFLDKLNQNIVQSIQQNLAIYKKYSKFAFDGIRLMVIGDVLNNSMSIVQLQNVIHMNLSKIKGIIFKDTGHIRPAAFTELMTQLFLIPQLDSIAFLSSVLDSENILELKYLLKEKQVKYIIINQSYFIKNEIDKLLDIKEEDNIRIKVNHSRFAILDILAKKSYEFCPYSFKMEEALQKKDEDLLSIERLYIFQKHYPKQIQEEINFYQARNVSILSNKKTDRVTFKHWRITKDISEDELLLQFPNQVKLTRTLEKIIQEDKINILNYGIVKKMISVIGELETKKQFEELLKSRKSVQYLFEAVPEIIAENIEFTKLSHLKLCHAYLLGFTRLKQFSIDLIINNEQFYNNLFDSQKIAKYLKNSGSEIIQNSIKGTEKDENQNREFMESIKNAVDFSLLVSLSISNRQPTTGNYSFLNDLVKKCVNLRELKLSNILLSDHSLENVDLSGISPELEVFDISQNPSLNSISFVDPILLTCLKLRKINFSTIEFNSKKANKINFSALADCVKELDLSFNSKMNSDILNRIFNEITRIEKIKLRGIKLNLNFLEKLKFPRYVKEIDIDENNDLDIQSLIHHIENSDCYFITSLTSSAQLPYELDSSHFTSSNLDGDYPFYHFQNLEKLEINCNTMKEPNLLRLMILKGKVKEVKLSEFLFPSFEKTGLDTVIHSLVSFELIGCSALKDFKSLTELLKKSHFIKKLTLQKLPQGAIEAFIADPRSIPASITDLDLNENPSSYCEEFINVFLKRCKNLKSLNISSCKLNGQKLNRLSYKFMSEDLEEIILDSNSELEEYSFINQFFKRCRKLKRISMQCMLIRESARDIDFSLAGPLFSVLEFDKVDVLQADDGDDDSVDKEQESTNYFTYEFQDWLMTKTSTVFGIYEFEDKNVHNQFSGKDINYFEIFEEHNINSQINSLERWENPKFNETRIQPSQANLDQIEEDFKDELQPWQIQETQMIRSYQEQGYFPHTNPWFFYLFFKELGQMPSEKNFQANQLLENLKIIEFQNVLFDINNLLLTIIHVQREKALRESLEREVNNSTDDIQLEPELPEKYDQKIFLGLVKQIILDGCHFKTLNFLPFFFKNCPNLSILDFSNSTITSENASKISVCNMPSVTIVNFAKISCHDPFIIQFVDIILQSCPNLKNLNMSSMNISATTRIKLNNISASLEVLDISKNKNFPLLLSGLSEVFKKCQQLKDLTMNTINLIKGSPSKVFENISKELLYFDMSFNPLVENVEIINVIIENCQKLKELNISKCKIEEDQFQKIKFSIISNELEELNVSGNAIFEDYNFINAVIIRSPKFKYLDISSQVIYKSPNISCKLTTSNVIESIYISGNISIDNYSFIADIVSRSTCFKKFVSHGPTLYEEIMPSFRFEEIGKQIEELDLQEQRYNFNLVELLHVNESENFTSFNVNYSKIGHVFFEQANFYKNLRVFEIADCKYILELQFLNRLFSTAVHLEVLNLSMSPATQEKFNQVDFKKIPKGLKRFFLNTVLLNDFTLVTHVIEATAGSLQVLFLNDCNLDSEKLKKIDFSKAQNTLKEVSLRENWEINSLEVFRPYFDKGNEYRISVIRLSHFTYEVIEFLAEFRNQIGVIDLPAQNLELSFFTNKEEILEINLIYFIRFLNDKTGTVKLQRLWRSNTKRGQLFRDLMKSLIEFRKDLLSTKLHEHFLFMILTNQFVPKQQLQCDFFILSPYTLFQQANDLDKSLDEVITSDSQQQQSNSLTAIPKVSSSSDPRTSSTPSKYQSELTRFSKSFCVDSFTITAQILDMLKNKNYKYIFGFPKYFFQENFHEFYMQNFTETQTDFDFTCNVHKIISEHGIERAFLPLRLTLSHSLLGAQNYNEFDALLLVNAVPPAVMILKDMSIQFIKSWYAINFSSPLSLSTSINVNYELIENSSIANFLQLRTFRMYIANQEPKTFPQSMKKLIGQIGYAFFSAFSSLPNKYHFDHTVIHLENKCKQEQGINLYLFLLYLVYMFICIFGVWFFQLKENIACGVAMPTSTYITYGIFGVVSFFAEAILFTTVIKFVAHLIPDMKPDCKVNFPNSLINSIKIKIMDIRWINRWYMNYILAFVNSQLSRFDFLTNLGFLYSTHSCGDDLLFYCTLASLFIINVSNLVIFFTSSLGEAKYGKMVTRQIDRLYQISSLLSFQSTAEILDIISPTNSVIIFKKMFNQRIVQNFVRIIFQDMPLIVIKTAFIIRHQSQGNSTIYPIISSSLMFLSSLSKFLSITPSQLGQADFNELSQIKKTKVLPEYEKQLKKVEVKLTEHNFYEGIKLLKSPLFFSDTTNDVNLPTKNLNDDLQILSEVYKFQNTQDTMKALFGNAIVVTDDKLVQFSSESLKFEDHQFLPKKIGDENDKLIPNHDTHNDILQYSKQIQKKSIEHQEQSNHSVFEVDSSPKVNN